MNICSRPECSSTLGCQCALRGLVYRNPAPDAAAPAGPVGHYFIGVAGNLPTCVFAQVSKLAAETPAQEVARLQREIAERQDRLRQITLGDQRVGVGFAGLPDHLQPRTVGT